MSNLSDIGFPVNSEDEFAILLEQAYESGNHLDTEHGFYVRYADLSGAELWLQFDHQGELIGMNPHFRSGSRIKVGLLSPVERSQSPLDGAWIAWTNPTDPSDPESGDYPFVFDAPDARLQPHLLYPGEATVQLAAFSQEVRYYPSPEAFHLAQQEEEVPFAIQSFVPLGLFTEDADSSPDATALITGIIQEIESRKNQLSGQPFMVARLQSLGLEIDLLLDPLEMPESPKVGAVIQCQAWLSGQIIKG